MRVRKVNTFESRENEVHSETFHNTQQSTNYSHFKEATGNEIWVLKWHQKLSGGGCCSEC